MHINKPDYRKRLTPQMTQVVDHILGWTAAHPPTENWRQDYIEERRFWNEGGPVPVKTLDLEVSGKAGTIPVRLHYPAENPAATHGEAVTVFIHGGGYYLGNNDTHSKIMRLFARESGTVVVGVDYHLAPEYKFPVQLEDTVAVVRYFQQNGGTYGLDPGRINLSGDSGGATLALAAALYLRDQAEGNAFIKSLILYYGAYGMRDSVSLRLYGNEIDGIMREYASNYYDEGYINPSDLKSPYYDLLNNDLTRGIPPVFLGCGDIDPLLDNSAVLAEILKDKGLPVEYRIYPGIMHAFLHYSRMLPEAGEALRQGAEFLKKYNT
jgi:acetyl esterase